MPTNYYFDKSKQRYIARFVRDGKRVQIGSFKTGEECVEAVKNYFSTNDIKDMPPKKSKSKKSNHIKTKNDAIEWIKTTYKSEKTVKLYTDNQSINQSIKTQDQLCQWPNKPRPQTQGS